ncbi:MAG: helix-turn-helix transcriptional regulator [Rhodospirillaceae bacterium]|nr:helix-turn-helix transcriptional regulator [Rhodospirillaceae bacterium]MYB12914.1 helix-turn-helix transcriptional regulator [Rhodospirillaceae bacterium]MYI49082.1 helix-turn-helix transcriptional regulator [Rhodospirillaceae bacterium]
MEASQRPPIGPPMPESRQNGGLDAYLAGLGERVRAARARRGMSRKVLSRASGVSERYLAQLEAGKGNISIGLLRKVAEAMSVPLGDLVREGERPVDLTLLIRKLERLQPDELAQANSLLTETLGLGESGRRIDRVALIGLRGAGKTTLGAALARRSGAPFIEMAREIERTAGMSVDQIFDLSGQAAYRRYERRALEDVLAAHPECVIAAGGSIVSEPETYEMLLRECFTVWLRATPEDHMRRVREQGDTRPMENSGEAMADLKRILETRNALYTRADVVLDTSSRSVEATLNALGLALSDARRKSE